MKVLITNIGNLYSPDIEGAYGDLIHLKNVSLLIEDGYIIEILHKKNSQVADIDQVINGMEQTLLPGFIDAHTHPVFWKTREADFIMRIEGKSYEEIAAAGGGIRNSARHFRTAGKEEIKEITRKRIRTFFEYGTTTIEAKSGYGLSPESEIKALEIISELNQDQQLEMIPTFLGAHEVPDDYLSIR